MGEASNSETYLYITDFKNCVYHKRAIDEGIRRSMDQKFDLHTYAKNNDKTIVGNDR